MLGKIFQLSYTQVFGIYAGYVYVFTGSFWAAAVLHAQCNLLGFPYFSNLFSDEFSLTKRMSKCIRVS
jgi:membrane protease YdiL (CAAX protease family)